MSKYLNVFEKIVADMTKKYPNVEASQMFGKPCLKVNGKAFCCFFDGDMVFKLTGLDHEKAMVLKGSKLFDPSGSGRPMKEWVQIYISQNDKWARLANAAREYVEQQTADAAKK